MRIGYYYRQDWAPEGVDPNILETVLGSDIEPKAQTAFVRLIQSPNDLTDDDTASILAYLEMQRIRVPKQARFARDIFRAAIMQLAPPEAVDAILRGEVRLTIKDSSRFDFMPMTIGQVHPWLGKMEWEVIEAERGASFLTTDNPVSYYNARFPPPSEPGLGLAGAIVLFPLTSRYLLVMRHPELLENRDVDLSLKLPEPQVEDGVIPITHGAVWSAEQVANQNWLRNL